MPAASTIIAGRDEVNPPVRRCRIDQGPTSQATEAETYERKDSGDGGGHGWEWRMSLDMYLAKSITACGLATMAALTQY